MDIGAGEKAVELIKSHVRSTFRPEVVGDIGGFGGLFALGKLPHRDPVLAVSTDGVGTKSTIARLMSRYDTIGVDVVAMSVDDIAVQGAEPLLFLDYLSVGKVVPETVDEIVSGVAEGCRQAGCALSGGEISEHPDLMEPGEFDLVGFAVGVVERRRDPAAGRPHRRPDHRVRQHRACVATATRSRGARCSTGAARALDEPAWHGAHHSLGDELLMPSVIYAPAMAELRRHADVHTFAHITGGGIPGNLVRALPDRCDGVVHRGPVGRAAHLRRDPGRRRRERRRDGACLQPRPRHARGRAAGRAVPCARRSSRRWARRVDVGEIVEGHGRAHIDRELRPRAAGYSNQCAASHARCPHAGHTT